MAKNETFSVLTGGGADSLDGITTPSNNDFAFGIVSDLHHAYIFDSSEVGGENSPYQIKANDATTGSWMLVGFKGAFSHVFATSDAGQSITQNTDTDLIFEDEVHDLLSEYIHTTGIFTAKYTGYYQVNVGILFDTAAWTAGNNIALSLGGTNTYKLQRFPIPLTTSQYYSMRGSLCIPLSVGSTVKAIVNHNGSGARTLIASSVWNHISIDRIA